MRGPFDGVLKWPFRGDVTIQIVDQAGEKHHEEVFPYNYNTPDISANREERSPSWDFFPHTSLGYNTVTKTIFMSNLSSNTNR